MVYHNDEWYAPGEEARQRDAGSPVSGVKRHWRTGWNRGPIGAAVCTGTLEYRMFMSGNKHCMSQYKQDLSMSDRVMFQTLQEWHHGSKQVQGSSWLRLGFSHVSHGAHGRQGARVKMDLTGSGITRHVKGKDSRAYKHVRIDNSLSWL